MAERDLSVRVTGLERDVQHAMTAVTQLKEAMDQGFSDIRQLFREQEARQAHMVQDLHSRITQTNEQSLTRFRPTLGGVVGVVSVAAVVIAGGVQFVRMTVAPLEQVAIQHREEIKALELVARQTAVLARTNEYQDEIAALRAKHAEDWRNWHQQLTESNTRRLTRLEQMERSHASPN